MIVDQQTAETMFSKIDDLSRIGLTISAHLLLGNGNQMTVRAGGAGVHSQPGCAPFSAYEVLLDHEPPRFWRRFGDTVGIIYADVPPLLVAHYIIRRGGIQHLDLQKQRRDQTVVMNVAMTVPAAQIQAVWAALRAIKGVELLSH